MTTFAAVSNNHVPIANRVIESREHNAHVQIGTQYRKETEFFELYGGYFFARTFTTRHGVVMMFNVARHVASSATFS